LRAIEYGALRYIAKPFTPAELVGAVSEAVRLRRLADAKRDALELLGQEAKLVGDRAGLEATFARALASLWMAYQPIVSLSDRRIVGYEALLRSGEPALPHPGAVLEAAERLGRVHTLGRIVRERVAETIAQTNDESVFFVNLHSHDLLDDSLVNRDSPLSGEASRIVLEITERASLEGLSDLRARITSLRNMGFRLAIDDLGAGYAGLTSFATIQPEIVKIDMSLVRGIDTNPVKRKIVDKLTALSHDLGIIVVAEGIETVEERDVLASIGCDLLQGYLFAKPGKPFPAVVW
jgi:EAL domain-containing protein (putative c-di-GMP-specific phosphodiesterase class I)